MVNTGEPGTSPATCLNTRRTSASELTRLMPLPPPPQLACNHASLSLEAFLHEMQ